MNTRHIQIAKTVSLENIRYLHSLPLYLRADGDENILVVHAGIVPNKCLKLEKQKAAHLMTLRNIEIVNNEMIGTNKTNKGKPWIRFYDGFNGHIFFGHDATKSLQIGKYATGLDTGAYYGNSLTATIIECHANNEDVAWKTESEKYTSSTSKPFDYWLYSVKSF